MKKASILSFQFPNNYGALLQIYALSTVLKKFNLSVDVIDFQPDEFADLHKPNIKIRKIFKEKKLPNALKDILFKTIFYPRNKKRYENFENFRKNYLNLTENTFYSNEDLNNNLQPYDYYFVGSDQVWNPYFLNHTGATYFLNFANEDSKKISYAASIATEIKDKDMLDYFESNLKRFDSISVREKSAKSTIEKLTDKNITVTLDPTLLLDREDWGELIPKKKENEKFILVYDLEKSESIIKLANKLSKETGYKIISFSNRNDYINKLYSFNTVSPNDFVRLFDQAEMVLTSSFHGTVFSVIFEKNFYTVPHSTRGSRMIDFLESVDLSDRIIKDSADFDNFINIDYTVPRKKLDEMKKSSLDFIRNSIK